MNDTDDLTAAWILAQSRLPADWKLDRLQCASASLAASDRSDDWIAVAIGPGGVERSHRAGDPVGALAGLAVVVGAG